MGQWSRILTFPGLIAATALCVATPALGGGPRGGFVRMPTFAPRMVAPKVAFRPVRPRLQPGAIRASNFYGPGRPGSGNYRGGIYGAGRSGLGRRGRGYGGAGFGLDAGFSAPPAYGGAGPEPYVIPADVPPRCVRPLMIKIGAGLRHPATTKVVYGPPQGCVP